MTESYKELLVARKESKRDKTLGILLVVLAVLSLAGIFFTPFSLLGIPVFGILSYFVYFRRMSVEYEYTYMDKELRIDRIYNRSKRKSMETLDLNNMEILAPKNSYHLDSYKNKPVSEKDYSSGMEDTDTLKTYVMYYEGKERILLSLDDEVIRIMRTTLAHKIKLD